MLKITPTIRPIKKSDVVGRVGHYFDLDLRVKLARELFGISRLHTCPKKQAKQAQIIITHFKILQDSRTPDKQNKRNDIDDDDLVGDLIDGYVIGKLGINVSHIIPIDDLD